MSEQLECEQLECHQLECEQLECEQLECEQLECEQLECEQLECHQLCVNEDVWSLVICRDMSWYVVICRDMSQKSLPLHSLMNSQKWPELVTVKLLTLRVSPGFVGSAGLPIRLPSALCHERAASVRILFWWAWRDMEPLSHPRADQDHALVCHMRLAATGAGSAQNSRPC